MEFSLSVFFLVMREGRGEADRVRWMDANMTAADRHRVIKSHGHALGLSQSS